MRKNIILNTDSYKVSHWRQYPPGSEFIYCYVEAREVKGGKWDSVLYFGLQMFLKEYLTTPITKEDIDEAEEVFSAHGVSFNREGWEHILKEHGGHLPVVIKALPEGSLVPVHAVMVTIENTDPKCFWLSSYLETALLRAVWYPTTVATTSYWCKQRILDFLEKTSDDPSQVCFKLHDFGARGVSSDESAALGGCAHLVNFRGTDTISSLTAARRYYGEKMAAFSIPAAEHSTITSWTKEGEVQAYSNMLDLFAKPGATVAVVSDSYDIMNAVSNIWGGELKERVIKSGSTLVIRPDSGDPLTILVEVVKRLMDAFGYTVNSKGYRVLPPCVRVIQGDGITYSSLLTILAGLEAEGIAVDNVAFGMGGGLLQQVNRDTLGFAMKCSAIRVDGEWRDVYKDPVTDKHKTSKKGRFHVIEKDGKLTTVQALPETESLDKLEVIFRDGKIVKEITFAEVRERASKRSPAPV